MSRRFTDEAFMRSDDQMPSATTPAGAADSFMMLPAPPLPFMQALAVHALYHMAFEQAQADARASAAPQRPHRYEPKWN